MKERLAAVASRWLPRRLRYAIQRHVNLTALKLAKRRHDDPHAEVLSSDRNTYGSPFRFGILRNAAQYHSHYVSACLELGVPFRVLDVYAEDWLDRIAGSGCDAFLVWPDAFLSVWGRMLKDRVNVIEDDLGFPVVPSSRELWAYEDKRRMAYWLRSHGVPHPRTWVFYDLRECESFVRACDLPIVYKASFGASSSGVRIFRDRKRLARFVRRVFSTGFVPNGFDRRDRQWGSVLLQEYLPAVKEWRMVRIGESFFGHGKGRIGDFHSGSGAVEWSVPEARHLDFLEQVTDAGGFRSMDVDVFETPEGALLVNELQTVFGAGFAVDQLRVDGVAGRFVRSSDGAWRFEAGEFARNACADERIRYFIESRRPEGPAARSEEEKGRL